MVSLVATGLLIGIAMGWVLQRGRYCMNSAFRDVIFMNDYILFKAYILALVVAIIGANALQQSGQVEQLRIQAFSPIANIAGGYIFGLGIVLAGGCGSGIWYKTGEGQFNAFVTIMGFFIGILSTKSGLLAPVYKFLRSFTIWQTPDGLRALTDKQVMDLWDKGVDVIAPTLYSVIGVNKWIVIAVLALIAIPFLIRGGILKPKKGYSWPLAGVLIGVIIIAAWWVSEKWGGGARGISYTGPTGELFKSILTGVKPTWGAMLVLGTPIGAFLSAKGLKEFKLNSPNAQELLRVFVGGLIMGFGATVGGG
ncbi:putative inner membrane protein [bacterium BMS3Abin07]|nr:putative inner membrane protein [bacterium BMS3Abin07]GBE31279.1 putative inner membrane protein [bacterium BMS3Bbin05]HDL21145.1 YeeE/YedE family protein [Nitrospirota bacterium]HDO23587.1 YeeE/YedE family protein [Nitrospirota bacterium]